MDEVTSDVEHIQIVLQRCAVAK